MMRSLLMFLIVVLMAACSSGHTDRALSAQELFESGDIEGARAVCDEALADSATFNALTPSQLCTIATLYVRFNGDIDTNDAAATRCLVRARHMAPDSVEAFFQTLAPDMLGRVKALDQVGSYLNMSRDVLVGAEDRDVDTIDPEQQLLHEHGE